MELEAKLEMSQMSQMYRIHMGVQLWGQSVFLLSRSWVCRRLRSADLACSMELLLLQLVRLPCLGEEIAGSREDQDGGTGELAGWLV